MKGITKVLMVGVLVGVISLLGYLTLSYGGDYRVSFQEVTMTPEEAKDGMRVIFTIKVKNDGQRLSNVQIRVVEPCNSRGEGRVLVDVSNQVINPGVNTYTVGGTFLAPTPDKQGVCISFLDRYSPFILPAPVITSSGYLSLLPVSYYKLRK